MARDLDQNLAIASITQRFQFSNHPKRFANLQRGLNWYLPSFLKLISLALRLAAS
jgi:hypothetical protein